LNTKDSAVDKLRKEGLKVTPQRLAIIEVFAGKRDSHPGARSVHEEAKKKKKSLSLSTTYATLNELSRLGIVKTLQFDAMENRYEGNLEEHLNLICKRCGKIFDYKVSPVADRQQISKEKGFSVTDTRLEYYGYCRDCRAQARAHGDKCVEDKNG